MKTLLYAIWVFAWPVLVLGQTAPATSEQSAEAAKRLCTVEGQILNLTTGAAVRKASVALKPTGTGTSYSATTDADGRFAIPNVEPARYTLGAERQGFVSQSYGARRPSGPGTIITLEAAQHLKDLVLKLTPQGVISGRVLEDEGEPVANIMTLALQYRYLKGHRRLVPAAAGGMTNDMGEYRVANLAPGRYYVAVSGQRMTPMQATTDTSAGKEPDEGYIPMYYPNATEPASAAAIEVGPGVELRSLDVHLRKGRVARVTGPTPQWGDGSAPKKRDAHGVPAGPRRDVGGARQHATGEQ